MVEEKRYNNFTTAEIKRFAKDPGDVSAYFDSCIESEDELKKIFNERGWKFEELENGIIDDFSDLSTFSVQCELGNAINILAWKILYERDLHKQAIDRIRNQLKDMKRDMKNIIKHGSMYYRDNLFPVNDPDLEIKEGDEDDYYDEYKFKKIKS
jgi:hypothetical protein